jgi:NADH:ubiquinone reductase (H+-translocating)
VKPNPLMENLPCPRSPHGAVVVDPHLAVPGYPGVWDLGDCAEVPRPDGQGSYAPTAQNAFREGIVIAHNVAATLRGDALQPFTYRPLGELALVGRHAGAA